MSISVKETVMQEAVLQLGRDQPLPRLELYTRLLHVNRRLRKAPEDIENAAMHSAAPRSKQPPKGVKLTISTTHGASRDFGAKPGVQITASSSLPPLLLHHSVFQPQPTPLQYLS